MQINQAEGAAASVLMIKVEFRMEEAYDCHNNCTTTKPIYSLDFVILIILLVLTAAPNLNIIAFRALQARHAGLSGLVVLNPCVVESVQDSLIKLDIKPCMDLVEISIFSLNLVPKL